jgi:hypothetical protein
LEHTIEDLKFKMNNDKQELKEIENEMNSMKAKYDLKKHEIGQQNTKLDEKLKVLNEAKKAYTKVNFNLIQIIESTTKLIDAVDLECQDES